MAMLFWNLEASLLLEYMSLQMPMLLCIKNKQWEKVTRGVLHLHNNAPVHNSQKSITVTRLKKLDRPTNNPDLAPSNDFLFQNIFVLCWTSRVGSQSSDYGEYYLQGCDDMQSDRSLLLYSEILMTSYQPTWHHIPEDSICHICSILTTL
jgi:hypothetical protein